MAIVTPTWGWWARTASTESGNNDLENSYNGFNFTIGGNTTAHGHGEFAMVDGDNNGTISAVQRNSTAAPENGDRIRTPDGVNRQLYEIAIYNNSVFTYEDANGDIKTYVARAVVYQLGNRDLVVRMRDDDRNNAPNDFFLENVTNIQLGTWDGSTYGNTIVSNFDEPPPNVCFVHGTLIETGRGPVAIQDLGIGDLVKTTNGLFPIRWIGSKKLSATILKRFPQLRPIRIKAGALGKNSPSSDLYVSPQHRILVRSKVAQRMFGASEVLVAAKQLLEIEGIEVVDTVTEVEYFHFLLNQHQIVIANGAEAETLYTGPQALKALDREALEEIFMIFPELRDRNPEHLPPGARPILIGKQGRKLATRHAQNNLALVS